RPGDTVVDIGANIGLWVLGAARRIGPSGRAEAFEPVPSTYARLSENVELNAFSTIRCHQLAMSDHQGTTTFYAATDGNSGRSSMGKMAGVDQAITVNLTTLDDFCEKNDLDRIDFLKVDVEGVEEQVFRGAKKVLSDPLAPPMLFEVGDQ